MYQTNIQQFPLAAAPYSNSMTTSRQWTFQAATSVSFGSESYPTDTATLRPSLLQQTEERKQKLTLSLIETTIAMAPTHRVLADSRKSAKSAAGITPTT
jgi:hypothetical protein